jgi:hypothetical protein
MLQSVGLMTRMALILAAAVGLFALVAYYQKRKERFSTDPAAQAAAYPDAYATTMGAGPNGGMAAPGGASAFAPRASPDITGHSPAATAAAFAPNPMEPVGNERYRPIPGVTGPAAPCDPFPQDRITPDQLLPKDAANSAWAQSSPAGQGDVQDQNLLTAGYHVGFDTQGNSLRNASHDIRSTPPNPRFRVSIWNQSNIDPDMNRRPLE